MEMADPFNLQRFVAAQDPVFEQVRSELLEGRKTGHWMWFIFPQIKGLGHSSMAERFAIASLAEAQAYLSHPTLGPRLRECTKLVIDVRNRTVREIFGYRDDMKFRSSMTLFSHATSENQLFKGALEKYFPAGFDRGTLDRI
jgi:uncharacterized protein (DUF1810 family)